MLESSRYYTAQPLHSSFSVTSKTPSSCSFYSSPRNNNRFNNPPASLKQFSFASANTYFPKSQFPDSDTRIKQLRDSNPFNKYLIQETSLEDKKQKYTMYGQLIEEPKRPFRTLSNLSNPFERKELVSSKKEDACYFGSYTNNNFCSQNLYSFARLAFSDKIQQTQVVPFPIQKPIPVNQQKKTEFKSIQFDDLSREHSSLIQALNRSDSDLSNFKINKQTTPVFDPNDQSIHQEDFDVEGIDSKINLGDRVFTRINLKKPNKLIEK